MKENTLTRPRGKKKRLSGDGRAILVQPNSLKGKQGKKEDRVDWNNEEEGEVPQKRNPWGGATVLWKKKKRNWGPYRKLRISERPFDGKRKEGRKPCTKKVTVARKMQGKTN